MKKIIFLFLFVISFLVSFGQSNNGIEMATLLRSSGKIYVVVAIVSIIFIGFIIYLFTIDRKIKRLEEKDQVK